MENLSVHSTSPADISKDALSRLASPPEEAAPRPARTETDSTRRESRPRPETETPSREELQAVVDELNLAVAGGNGIRFKISPESQDLVVQVVDRESDEVIRSIPPERLSEFATRFNDTAQGTLLDDEA